MLRCLEGCSTYGKRSYSYATVKPANKLCGNYDVTNARKVEIINSVWHTYIPISKISRNEKLNTNEHHTGA